MATPMQNDSTDYIKTIQGDIIYRNHLELAKVQRIVTDKDYNTASYIKRDLGNSPDIKDQKK